MKHIVIGPSNQEQRTFSGASLYEEIIPFILCSNTIEKLFVSSIRHHSLLLFSSLVTFLSIMKIYQRYKHVKMRDISRFCAI